MKRCTVSLIIREIRINLAWATPSHLLEWLLTKDRRQMLARICRKRNRSLCIVDGNVNCCIHWGKQSGGSSKIELPYDAAIPLLSVYLKEMKSLLWRDICTPLFIAMLLTTTKTWKWPKCSIFFAKISVQVFCQIETLLFTQSH